MNINEMQQIVEEWVSNPKYKVKYFPPFEIAGQLSEEVGEVAREISHLHGFKKKKDGEKTEGLASEIGDVLFVLCCLSNSHNISLEKAFKISMEKKTGRDQHRFEK